MTNYYYFDRNGQKQGPIDDRQLQVLVSQKLITQTTSLETETGQKTLAAHIPGLNFTSTSPPVQSPTPAAPVMTPGAPKFCSQCGTPINPALAGCTRCGSSVGLQSNVQETGSPPWNSVVMVFFCILSALFPFFGWIVGGISLNKRNSESKRSQAKKLLIIATVMFVIYFLIGLSGG